MARESEASVADGPSLPSDYREAEEVLTRLRGVSSSHIVVDSAGQIAEVHVIASGERQPKQIVRDVESALSAKLGIKVDHRKVSVALLRGVDPPAAQTNRSGGAAARRDPEPPRRPRLEPEPEPAPEPTPRGSAEAGASSSSRMRFNGLNLHVSTEGCQASVELLRGAVRTLGEASGPAVGQGALRSLAEATLGAVTHNFEEGSAFVLDELALARVGQREVILVSSSYHSGRDAVHLVGSAFVGIDPQQAVIFATLDAVNRFTGRLKEREFVEYEVGPTPTRA